jgi:hypothetical protein
MTNQENEQLLFNQTNFKQVKKDKQIKSVLKSLGMEDL